MIFVSLIFYLNYAVAYDKLVSNRKCIPILGFATYSNRELPSWFHILSITGLFISLILLRCLKVEPKSDDIIEESAEEKKTSWLALVLLVISALYLTAIGVFELLSRLNLI
ncbi:MAG: hypothetical protein EWM47_12450 [Anaerolineaceae bacterium]|nr:MAG: hypothetical protein EWM47_12450 [Anaerolineaceae bacterium]